MCAWDDSEVILSVIVITAAILEVYAMLQQCSVRRKLKYSCEQLRVELYKSNQIILFVYICQNAQS